MSGNTRVLLFSIGFCIVAMTAACSSEAEFSSGAGKRPPVKDAEANPAEPEEPVNETPVDPETPVVEEPVTPKTPMSIEREFSPVTVEEFTADYDPEYQYVDQAVTLKEMPPMKINSRQLDRNEGRESFQQGRDAQRADPESFLITEAGKLDLLVVMDDSTSMDAEKANLASKLDPLISKLENTDWQIAVVTTSDPCLRDNRLIKKSDADRTAAFAKAINDIVLDNLVIEKGFPMSIKALKGECKGVTSPWVRANAAVGVLIVSDEDNCGSNPGEGCPGEQGETVTQMIDFLRSIRPADQGRIYGLFEGANECGSSAYTATKYKQAVDLTGGRWGSICQNDYTTTLQQISEDIRKIVKRDFTLKYPADPSTLLLSVDGNAKTTGFTLSGKVLTVTDFSALDKILVVNYSYGAVPKKKNFKVTGNLDPSTIAVFVNDVPVANGDLTYDASSKDIMFVNEPLDNAVVKVIYKLNTPLPKDFSLAGSDILGTPLSVKVENVDVSDYTFDANSKKVVFDTAPRDGKNVEITFRTKSGRIVRYASALANLGSAKMISAVDRESGQSVNVTADANDLVFNPDDVSDGRIFDIRYDIGYKPDDLNFQLAHSPIGGVVDVGFSDTSCEKQVSVLGREVKVDCGRGKAGTINLKYRAITNVETEFSVDGDSVIPENAEWKVFVDDVLVTNPVRSGHAITLSEGVFTEGSKVKIVVTWNE